MGLTVYVYRNALGDSTNGGISATTDRLTVVNVDGPSVASDEAPAVVLTEGNLRGTVVLRPAAIDADGVVWTAVLGMFGGNYGATSDSRFREAVERIVGGTFHGAVAIHDRFE